MSHWLLDTLTDSRQQALKQASRAQIYRELLNTDPEIDYELIRQAAEALELAVLDFLIEGVNDDEPKQIELKQAAADAFRLLRVLPRSENPFNAGMFLLRVSALAVVGDKGSDAARWLKEDPWPALPIDSNDWSKRIWATVFDIWLRLIRKDGWTDRDAVLDRIDRLRAAQAEFEKNHLDGQKSAHAKATALELIGLYHLAKAAEILARYITDCVVNGRYQIHQLLDTHFDRVMEVCEQAQLIDLEPISRLLEASAWQMAENSIWCNRSRPNHSDKGEGISVEIDMISVGFLRIIKKQRFNEYEILNACEPAWMKFICEFYAVYDPEINYSRIEYWDSIHNKYAPLPLPDDPTESNR